MSSANKANPGWESALRILVRTVRSGEPAPPQIPLLRRLLLTRRFYDVSSALVQLYWLRYIKNAAEVLDPNDPYYANVQRYNASVTIGAQITTTRRTEELFQVLRLPARDLSRERVLLIGPRNVQEFYTAWLYGFSWNAIEGVDLYKTFPRIHVMNMEAMTFPDATFDCIAMSHTLAYAKSVRTCLAECARVLKTGGQMAFGATYCPDSDEFAGNQVSGDEIRAILAEVGLTPYYYRQSEKVNKLGLRQTAHYFGVRKTDPGATVFDPVRW